jgi:aconitate hydratase
MGLSVAEKIIASHLASGKMVPGEEIALRVDQTLTQDATGTLAYLEFESLGIPRIRTKFSVSYVDHNTLQAGFENADDHLFLQTFAARSGIRFSRPGNGICHQVHLERFGRPGEVLLGSDSHTPTAGGLGMLGIGVGGLEIAAALAGRPYSLSLPEIFQIRLSGSLPPWVSAKDIILFVLKEISVKGGVGRILEYGGTGLPSLSVPERAVIANMGAETGATSTVFPSDEQTAGFLGAQKRRKDFREIKADRDARYAGELEVNLSALEPLAACPHSPDAVKPVSELSAVSVSQVCIGSCTNSSLKDLSTVAAILKGKRVHPNVSLVISPGSRQALTMIAKSGELADLTAAGARILETACGPCIGMGQAPASGGVSVRTYNRNFPGRSGTKDASIYLVSAETAAATALAGRLTDPRTLGAPPAVSLPKYFAADDSMVLPPSADPASVTVIKGPNISNIPVFEPLPESLGACVRLAVGDNISTDAIMPAGAKVLPFRSNIEKISRFVFSALDPDFAARSAASRDRGEWTIVLGGENYGQGSSREHAALAPRFLGVRAVIARSFARIHRANLINFGILPLRLPAERGEGTLSAGDQLEFPHLRRETEKGERITVRNRTRGSEMSLLLEASLREREILLAGGMLNLLRKDA